MEDEVSEGELGVGVGREVAGVGYEDVDEAVGVEAEDDEAEEVEGHPP